MSSPLLLRGLQFDEGGDDIIYEDENEMEEEPRDQTCITEFVVFLAYKDGSIHLYSLPTFKEICRYSQIYVGNSVLQPTDGKSRGRNVYVRELVITEVGVSEERVMRECVLTVRLEYGIYCSAYCPMKRFFSIDR